MRYIRLAIISFIVFALLFTCISLLFPSHIRLSKAIDIKAPKDAVLALLTDPHRLPEWLPANNGKKGELYITSKTDSTVTATTSLMGTKDRAMGWNIYATHEVGVCTIQWYADFHLRWYPWEKFSALLLEKRYGPVMEKGLANIKALLEKP